MKAKLIRSEGGEKTSALVFDAGDEAIGELASFAKGNGPDAASFTALGASSGATLGYFDMEKKGYEKIPVEEQVEVLSLVDAIAPKEDGEPQVHAHAVLGRSDGPTRGGYLLEGNVRPTLEVVLEDSPEHLRRETDPKTGLPC